MELQPSRMFRRFKQAQKQRQVDAYITKACKTIVHCLGHDEVKQGSKNGALLFSTTNRVE